MEQNFAGWITGSDAVLAPGKGESGRRKFGQEDIQMAG